MTDLGLSDRLRQKSRRAGLAVGLSMALTIAICIAGATVIYAALVEPLNDLIPIPAPQMAAPQRSGAGSDAVTDARAVEVPGQPAGSSQAIAAAPTETPPTPAPTPTPEPTQPAETFEPTHQIRGDQAVNLRTEPSRSDSGVIRALPPATALLFLDDEVPTENPVEDGDVWMLFETENGEEGWVREIDVTNYVP